MKEIRKLNLEKLTEKEVNMELNEAYELDSHFSDSKVLYSMCNKPPAVAIDAHIKFIESNLGDPGLYPGTLHLEKCVINMLADLLHGKNAFGHILSGGSEANLTSLYMANKRSKGREVIASDSVHYSVKVACDMLKMELKLVGLDEKYRMLSDEVDRMINKNTAAVIALAGSTELGVIDPIDKLSRICHDSDVHLHVDAAFGGFLFPFLEKLGYKVPMFDFILPGVTSITVDPHKLGHSTMPAGALLTRNPEIYNSITTSGTFYLSSNTLTTILGTRCSASVASTYAVMRRLGVDGYMKMINECMEKTKYITKLIKEIGLSLAIEPISPVICIKFESDKEASIIQKDLAKDGWRVSRTVQPPGIRLVIMPQVTKEKLTMFIGDLQNIYQMRRTI